MRSNVRDVIDRLGVAARDLDRCLTEAVLSGAVWCSDPEDRAVARARANTVRYALDRLWAARDEVADASAQLRDVVQGGFGTLPERLASFATAFGVGLAVGAAERFEVGVEELTMRAGLTSGRERARAEGARRVIDAVACVAADVVGRRVRGARGGERCG